MNWKQLFPGLVLVFCLISCGGPAEQKTSSDAASDSTTDALSQEDQELIDEEESYPEWEHDEVFKMMIGLFGEKQTFMPYPVDSAYIQTATDRDSLPSPYVVALSHHLSKHKLNESIGWVLKDYYTIDSLKRVGKIQSYWDQLDIAQTRDCNAYAKFTVVMFKVSSFTVEEKAVVLL